MSKNILIVDDSKFTLEITSFTIETAGYKSFTAQNALESLEILVKEDIDLMIIDIVMPDMDGYTLIKKIRADKKLIEKPIIIITTQNAAKDQQKGIEAGANVYLIKPVNEYELIAQIKLLIGDSE